MEEYNDYEEYENFDNSEELKEAAERIRAKMIRDAIEKNYMKIVTKGIDEYSISTWNKSEINEIIETVDYMLEVFEIEEAYERCANLLKAKECLLQSEPFEPIL
tara:strand:- start:3196 stop:3507 length:312 start_codon:yes stop_codon:yes gene_type:complete